MPVTVATLDVLIQGNSTSLQRALNESERELDRFSGRASQSLTALGQTLTATLTTAVAGGFGYAIRSAIDFEDQFANVAKTVDETAEYSFGMLSDALRQLAVDAESPVSTLDNAQRALTDIAAVAGQLGVPIDNIRDFSQTIALLTQATPLGAEQAAMMMAQFINVMGTGYGSAAKLADVLVELGNNFATTEDKILNVAQRFSGIAAQANIAAEDVLALSTSLLALGVKPEIAGSTLTALGASMVSSLSSGSETIQDFLRVTDMSFEEFKNTLNTNGTEAIMAFLRGLEGLDSAARVDLLDKVGLGGVRRTPAILALVENLDLLERALQDASTEMGNTELGAAMVEGLKKAETLGASIRRLMNTLRETAITIGDILAPTIRILVDRLTGFLNNVRTLNPAILTLGMGIAGVVAAIGPALIVFGTLLGAINPITVAVGLLAAAVITNFDTIKNEVSTVFGEGSTVRTALDAVKAEIDGFFTDITVTEPPLVNMPTPTLSETTITGLEDIVIQTGDTLSGIVANSPELMTSIGLYTDKFWELVNSTVVRNGRESELGLQAGDIVSGEDIARIAGGAPAVAKDLALQFSGPYYDTFNQVVTAEGEGVPKTIGEALSSRLSTIGTILLENLPDFSFVGGQLFGRLIKGLISLGDKIYNYFVTEFDKIDVDSLLDELDRLVFTPFVEGFTSDGGFGPVDFVGILSNPIVTAFKKDLESVEGFVNETILPGLKALKGALYVPMPELELPDISFAAGQFTARIIKTFIGLGDGIYGIIIDELSKIDIEGLLTDFETNVVDPFVAGLTSNRGFGEIDLSSLPELLANNLSGVIQSAGLLLLSYANPMLGVLASLAIAAFNKDVAGIRSYVTTTVIPSISNLFRNMNVKAPKVNTEGLSRTVANIRQTVEPIIGAGFAAMLNFFEKRIKPGIDAVGRGIQGFLAQFDGMDTTGLENAGKALAIAVGAVVQVSTDVAGAAFTAVTSSLEHALPILGSGLRDFADALTMLSEGDIIGGLTRMAFGILTIAGSIAAFSLDTFILLIDEIARIFGFSSETLDGITTAISNFFSELFSISINVSNPITWIANEIERLIDLVNSAPSAVLSILGIGGGGGGGGNQQFVQTPYGVGMVSVGGGGNALPEGQAFGGMVRTGVPTFVGEKGPELFVPPSSGRIIPNYNVRDNSSSESNSGNVYIYNPTFVGTDSRGVLRAIEREQRRSGRRFN